MNQNEFNRLNFLSEKSLTDIVSSDELEEFTQLMTDWNTSQHFNLFQDLHSYKNLPEK